MSRSYRHGFWYENDLRCERPRPRHWQEWQRILNVAPILRTLLPNHPYSNEPTPLPMHPENFLRLVASFADPIHRDILARLVFDLMYEDLKKLFISHCERMHGWQRQKRKQIS